MYLSSPGIILRQTKIDGGRKMLELFTEKYGKISASAQADSKGKNRSALALKPFTYGNYQIFQGKNYYAVDKAETVKSFYGIGEDLDKYFQAGFVLELTDKLLPEGVPQPAIFSLLMEFFTELENRKSRYETLTLAYEFKVLRILGYFPEMSCCAICGSKENLKYFSISDGGIICENCRTKIADSEQVALIYKTNFDIVNTVEYLAYTPLSAFRKIALSSEIATELQKIARKYMEYHLDIHGLKSDSYMSGNI